MPRHIWSGTISLGLVNVPVKLYNSVKVQTIRFHQLRKSDGCRIRLKNVCASDGAEVPAEEIVKGYEISPGRHVVVAEEDLDALNPENTRKIEIEDFVRIEQIDPVYYEKSYYLAPDNGAAKAYSLLLLAMQKTGKVAVTRFVLHSKQHLAVIRPAGKSLNLSTMYFADEVVAQEQLQDLPPLDDNPAPRELNMAEQLIDSLSVDFDPLKYHDDFRERMMDLINRKSEGETVVAPLAAEGGGRVIDLMAALEASLAAVKQKTPVKKKTSAKERPSGAA
jgi:DNA end-binding protein Ku